MLLHWTYRIQDGRSMIHFMPTSSNCIGSPRWGSPRPVPGLVDWLLQMIPPTAAFYGEHSPSAGSSTPSPLCGVHLFGGNKDFCWCLHLGWFLGDRCWARTLDLCVSSFVMIPRVFRDSRLSDRGFGASPCAKYIPMKCGRHLACNFFVDDSPNCPWDRCFTSGNVLVFR